MYIDLQCILGSSHYRSVAFPVVKLLFHFHVCLYMYVLSVSGYNFKNQTVKL